MREIGRLRQTSRLLRVVESSLVHHITQCPPGPSLSRVYTVLRDAIPIFHILFYLFPFVLLEVTVCCLATTHHSCCTNDALHRSSIQSTVVHVTYYGQGRQLPAGKAALLYIIIASFDLCTLHVKIPSDHVMRDDIIMIHYYNYIYLSGVHVPRCKPPAPQ